MDTPNQPNPHGPTRRLRDGIRRIHQLMLSERDDDALATKACGVLVQTAGCLSAVIVLGDPASEARTFSDHIRTVPGFEELPDRLASGPLPACVELAIERRGPVIATDPLKMCGGCELPCRRAGCVGWAAPLQFGDRCYGVVAASFLGPDSLPTPVCDLLASMVDDLALAFHRMELDVALANSRTFLAGVLDNLPGMAYRCRDDAEWTMLYASRNSQCLTGYSPDELIGNRVVSFLDLVVPEDRPKAEAGVRAGVDQNKPYNIEYRLRRRDGSLVDVWDRGFAVRDAEGRVDHLDGLILDITARRQAERALRASEERFHHLLRDVDSIAVQGYRADGTTTYWNSASESLYGYTEAEALGRPLWDLIIPAPMRAGVMEAVRAAVLEDRPIPGEELTLRHKDGSPVAVYSSHHVLRIPGREPELFCIDIDVSERRRMQAELVQLNADLEARVRERTAEVHRQAAALDAAVEGVAMLHDGRITYANISLCRQFALSREELLAADWRTLFQPAQRAALDAALHALSAATPLTGDVVAVRPDGSEFFAMVEMVLLADGGGDVLLMIHDMTARHMAEARLADREARYHAVMEGAPSAILIANEEGTILEANASATRLFDAGVESLAGQSIESLHPAEDLPRVRAHFAELHRVGSGRLTDVRINRRDGTTRRVEVLGTRITVGRNIVIQSIFRDITEEMKAAEVLQKANADLAQAARMKDEFLATMSHELRTPLNAVLGMSEALREGIYGPMAERQLRAVDRIEKAGRHLLDLINDILDIARIEAGKVELITDDIAVHAILRDLRDVVEGLAATRRIEMTWDIAHDVDRVHADPRRLRQILLNILGNAVKFAPDAGHVSCRVRLTDEDHILFVIEDDGPGIPLEKQALLFKPFVQLEDTLTREHGGTGLGLTIARRLVMLHHGTIEIHSARGAGCRVHITLPAGTGARTAGRSGLPTGESAAPLPRAGAPPTPAPRRPRILIADDQPANLALTAEFLTARGFDCLTAEDGIEAVEKTLAEHPDLVVMDVQMPRLDGLGAIQRLRANGPATAKLPIISLTAFAMAGDRQKCLDAGATDYLSKPVSLRALEATIRRLLGHRG